MRNVEGFEQLVYVVVEESGMQWQVPEWRHA